MAQTKEGAIKIAAKKAGLTIEEYQRLVDSGLKKCTKCKDWQSASNFNKDSTRWDGKSSKCHSCTRVKDPYASARGRPSPHRGRKHTPEARANMRRAHQGKPSPMEGKRHTLESRRKMSESAKRRGMKGAKHPRYQHGRFQVKHDLRRSSEYKWWRIQVFERDNYTCKKCGDSRGGNLRAHHIKPFAEYPERRFDVSNGLTLCHPCHELEHFKPDSIRNQQKLKRGQNLIKE